MTSAAASRSSRPPVALGNRLDAQSAADERGASALAVDLVADPIERVLERRVRDGESREHLGSEETRAQSAGSPAIGPNPSPARPAAATAALQSGSHRELVGGEAVRLVQPRRTSQDRPSAARRGASSFATASGRVSPPTSTPATCVPAASSLREPANARPTRIARAAAIPATTSKRPRRRIGAPTTVGLGVR